LHKNNVRPCFRQADYIVRLDPTHPARNAATNLKKPVALRLDKPSTRYLLDDCVMRLHPLFVGQHDITIWISPDNNMVFVKDDFLIAGEFHGDRHLMALIPTGRT
jgi:hypothetical protein